MIEYAIDPQLSDERLDRLWQAAWGSPIGDYARDVLPRSLGYVGAYEGERLVGFVNLAWDGSVHAFVLDTCVDPEFRRQGIGRRLIAEAARTARERGATWLHVDFEPHLDGFYRGCGFRPTAAGLIRL